MTNLVIRNACWAIILTAGSGALPLFAQTPSDASPSARREEGVCTVHGHVVTQTAGAPLDGASLELVAVRKAAAAKSAAPTSEQAIALRWMRTLTLREKIAQLVVIGFSGHPMNTPL